MPDSIPAIVDKDLFEEVQQKIKKNSRAPARHKAEDDYLLTTKLFCGMCGAMMFGECGTGRNKVVHHYYKCATAKRFKTCKKKTVRKEWLEDLVIAETMKLIQDDAVIDAIVAEVMELQDQTKQNAAIAAMEQNIRQYEAENKTGNPVLDTLLTAKTMECQQENITITSVADGRMLGFLTIRELCTIVGVALDHAIAAVRAEPDPEKRLIKVAVYSQGGFAMLRFEHYTEAAPALDADGLPKQGSDLKSVRTTAQQHGGSMTMHWENNWCTLRILFPLSKDK